MNLKAAALMVVIMWSYSCALAAGQYIETDPSKWLSYEIHYSGHVVSLRVPPNHRFKEGARVRHVSFTSSEPIKQIFTAQYDFGWRRWASIAQFEVEYRFVTLDASLSSDASPAAIGDAVGRVYEREVGRASDVEEKKTERAADNIGGSWVRKFDPRDPFVEYFANRCGPNLVLQVTVRYTGRDPAKEGQWFRERRALFHEMVAQVECH